jgi:hypothetical protein
MKRTPLALTLAVAIVATACEDARIAAPQSENPAGASDADGAFSADWNGPTGKRGRHAPPLSVMTWNLYVGTDVDAVILALANDDPSDDFPTLLQQLQVLQATDFPTRAKAFADHIQRERPHVVGLNEVSNIFVDLTAYGVPVNFGLGFLGILQMELWNRGLNYVAVDSVLNIDASPVPGIRLMDFDVLLVDADRVTTLSTFGKNFEYNIGPVAPGVSLIRGWLSATVSLDDEVYTVVTTHTEAGGENDPTSPLPTLRAAQISEITGLFTATADTHPVIIVGDLNDVEGSPMYQVLEGAGFTDVWDALRPFQRGYTCCHQYDLSNPRAEFTKRIDYIWARGLDLGKHGLKGQIEILGESRRDRVDGPVYDIWPSDHAGLVATLGSRIPYDF